MKKRIIALFFALVALLGSVWAFAMADGAPNAVKANCGGGCQIQFGK